MALRNLIGIVTLAAAFVVGCGGTVDSQNEEAIQLTNATVTKNTDSTATLTDGELVIHAQTLTGIEQEGAGGWCCTGCNINTGNCAECHTCAN
ncbi:hypothetical protein [Archangium lipolyticum]|uniref:hypothetical protein n=1 Tax=Archangium lipolyticum TaxID=2970465 RepID=UPI002149FEAE|nr:hypothetical protein [Archangium lipolyticum]